jgi:hypothetical protein
MPAMIRMAENNPWHRQEQIARPVYLYIDNSQTDYLPPVPHEGLIDDSASVEVVFAIPISRR